MAYDSDSESEAKSLLPIGGVILPQTQISDSESDLYGIM